MCVFLLTLAFRAVRMLRICASRWRKVALAFPEITMISKLLHDLILTAQGKHPGILIVRRDNNPKKDMSPSGTTRALHKLLKAEIPLENGLHILNHWR